MKSKISTKNKMNVGKISVVTAKKKISLISAILLVIGSSIGAGIFLKNGEILRNVQHSVILAVMSWVIAIIGLLALGFALPEICSGSGTANSQGIVGWVKKYNSSFMYQGAKNFMAYLHLPIYYFIMPYYSILVLQDAFGFQLTWYYSALISLAISSWFLVISGMFSHAANIQNWVITSIKFLPLLFAALIGFILVGLGIGPDTIHWLPSHPATETRPPLFSELVPALGMFCSIPAVFFAFDGFYATAGIQTEMKEPKRSSTAMIVGLFIVSVIDIIITFSLVLGTADGKITGLTWLNDHCKWVIQVMQTLIAFGIFGIINGLAVYTPRFYEDLIKEDNLPFCSKWKSKLNSDKPVVGTIVACVISLGFFIFGTIVGAFAYLNTGYVGTNYGSHMGTLYSFADLLGNWNALLAFVFIEIAVLGALINRRTKRVKVEKKSYFVPAAIVSLLVVGIGSCFVFIDAIGDLVLIAGYYKNHVGQVNLNDLIGAIMAIITLFIFVAIMFLPAIPSYIKEKHAKCRCTSSNR